MTAPFLDKGYFLNKETRFHMKIRSGDKSTSNPKLTHLLDRLSMIFSQSISENTRAVCKMFSLSIIYELIIFFSLLQLQLRSPQKPMKVTRKPFLKEHQMSSNFVVLLLR